MEKTKDVFDDMRKKISEPDNRARETKLALVAWCSRDTVIVLLGTGRQPDFYTSAREYLYRLRDKFPGKLMSRQRISRPETPEDEKKEKIILNVSSTWASSCSEPWAEQI